MFDAFRPANVQKPNVTMAIYEPDAGPSGYISFTAEPTLTRVAARIGLYRGSFGGRYTSSMFNTRVNGGSSVYAVDLIDED